MADPRSSGVQVETNEAERRRWNDERWTSVWPKREGMTDAISPFVLEAAALRAGERVLDIGSGGGRLSLAAARAVGAGGSVVGADLSAPLGELAGQRAREEGVANVEFQRLDMQTDRIPGDPFTVAISQFGVMFFDDPVAAFGNIRAHLAPDGRLVFACWQRFEDNPWHYASALSEFLPSPPPSGAETIPPGPFAFADPARTAQILTAARFRDVRSTPYELTVDVPEGAIFDDIQLTLMEVAPEHHQRARSAVRAYLRQFELGNGLARLPLAFQVVQARTA
jgi:SAM-dependent methyltransferase